MVYTLKPVQVLEWFIDKRSNGKNLRCLASFEYERWHVGVLNSPKKKLLMHWTFKYLDEQNQTVLQYRGDVEAITEWTEKNHIDEVKKLVKDSHTHFEIQYFQRTMYTTFHLLPEINFNGVMESDYEQILFLLKP